MRIFVRQCAFSLVSGLLLTCALPGGAERITGKWESSRGDNGARMLSYSGTATLLGKTTPVSVNFYCDPTASKDVNGAIGFDLYLASINGLSTFSFVDFEGPDAPALETRLMQVTVTRKVGPAAAFAIAPSGWHPVANNFAFGVSAPSREPRSTPKAILQALGAGAESLHIVITDYRDAKIRLEIALPVTGKAGEFKALLAGLK